MNNNEQLKQSFIEYLKKGLLHTVIFPNCESVILGSMRKLFPFVPDIHIVEDKVFEFKWEDFSFKFKLVSAPATLTTREIIKDIILVE